MSDVDVVNNDIAAITAAAQQAAGKYSQDPTAVGSGYLSAFDNWVGGAIGLGDSGQQEVGAIKNITAVTIPAIQRITAANVDANGMFTNNEATKKINGLFNDTIKSLSEIGAWSADSSGFQAVKFTVVETAADVASIPGKILDNVNQYQIYYILGGLVLVGVVAYAVL